MGPLVSTAPLVLYSALEIINANDSGWHVRVVYTEKGHLQSPNWTPNNNALVFTQNGLMRRISMHGGEPETIKVEGATIVSLRAKPSFS